MIPVPKKFARTRWEWKNGGVLLYKRCSYRLYSKKIIREHDVVLLKKKGDAKTNPFLKPLLSKPLVPGDRLKIQYGVYKDKIEVDDIIGKGVRELVTSRKGDEYRIYEPTLAEYSSLSPRVVTPIYPQDASLIVSLLDLHPSTPGADEDRLEIFEAGTGHGSLTLQLARAIHGANYPAPEIPPLFLPKKQTSSTTSVWESLTGLSVNFKTEDPYKTWRANRRAIIHTLDISASYSTHAQHVVRNFRRGLYSPHIDFHVGTIPDYLSSRLSSTNSPFLSHAILDLPETHKYMGIVGEALKPNGSLMTWNPSVSQVMKCVEMVRDSRLPFLLERVLETGSGTGAGPREWDVRSVKPRARAKAEAEAKAARGGWESTLEESMKVDEDGEQGAGITEAMDHSDLQAPNTEDSGWEMVCRPKVGLRIEGGGFIGLWRRMEYY